MTACAARLVYRPDYAAYDFGAQHPLRPERLTTSLELMRALGIAPDLVELPSATVDELALVHDTDYIDAVQRLSAFGSDAAYAREAARWGMGAGDSPAFAGMHAVSAAIAGGSLHALRGVLDGEFFHAFNPGGGLHHAMRNRASGFCIYNDPAVAIAAAVRSHGARVLYLDFDAHHGDGVQAAFYDSSRVLTFSIHESGRYLFPGTGFVDETGSGEGRGYSLNLPMEPFTEDDSWLACIESVVPRAAEWFAPDVIVSQHGCDSHAWDPITHLRISTRAFATQVKLVHQLAHRLCGGRWIATGGGGYDWVRVVPRSWNLIWAEMSDTALPDALPEQWVARWSDAAREHDFWPMPHTMLDEPQRWPPVSRRGEIEQANHAQVEALRQRVPALQRMA